MGIGGGIPLTQTPPPASSSGPPLHSQGLRPRWAHQSPPTPSHDDHNSDCDRSSPQRWQQPPDRPPKLSALKRLTTAPPTVPPQVPPQCQHSPMSSFRLPAAAQRWCNAGLRAGALLLQAFRTKCPPSALRGTKGAPVIATSVCVSDPLAVGRALQLALGGTGTDGLHVTVTLGGVRVARAVPLCVGGRVSLRVARREAVAEAWAVQVLEGVAEGVVVRDPRAAPVTDGVADAVWVAVGFPVSVAVAEELRVRLCVREPRSGWDSLAVPVADHVDVGSRVTVRDAVRVTVRARRVPEGDRDRESVALRTAVTVALRLRVALALPAAVAVRLPAPVRVAVPRGVAVALSDRVRGDPDSVGQAEAEAVAVGRAEAEPDGERVGDGGERVKVTVGRAVTVREAVGEAVAAPCPVALGVPEAVLEGDRAVDRLRDPTRVADAVSVREGTEAVGVAGGDAVPLPAGERVPVGLPVAEGVRLR